VVRWVEYRQADGRMDGQTCRGMDGYIERKLKAKKVNRPDGEPLGVCARTHGSQTQ
jgi:hypothetical protein